jgi:hypothetical protein
MLSATDLLKRIVSLAESALEAMRTQVAQNFDERCIAG